MTALYVVAGLALVPLILASLYIHARFNALFRKYSGEPVHNGVPGDRLARMMLNSAGLNHVVVEEIGPELEDHYDPRQKVVRLSRSVARSSSVAAISIAAHEAAHAIQDGTDYPPFNLRNTMAPLVEKAGYLVLPLLFFGVFLGRAVSFAFVNVALLLLLVTVAFYIVTLPIELEASSRAVRFVKENEIADEDELDGVRQMLRAASLTYVVGAALAVTTFLRLLGLSRRR